MRTKRAKPTPRQLRDEAEEVFSNVDLLQQILLHVPATSLIRLKTVSKQWLSIISDAKFASDHTQLNPKPSISGMYLSKNKEFLKPVSLYRHTNIPTLAFLDKVDKDRSELGYTSLISVADSCNGLLLCCYNYSRKHYLVCNPTTGNYKLLPTTPPGPGLFQLLSNHSAVLVFNPSRSIHYKVVLVTWGRSHCPVEIYFSSTASWKQLVLETCFLGPCVYWEGAVQWTMCSKEKRNIHCLFNVDSEQLEVITLPSEPKIHSPDKVRYFGVCGGRLLLIQSYHLSHMSFKILELGSGQSCWTVKCQVSLEHVFPSINGVFSVANILEGGDKDDLELVIAVSHKVFSYNVKSKTRKYIADLPPPKVGFYKEEDERRIRGFQFIGSLAQVT